MSMLWRLGTYGYYPTDACGEYFLCWGMLCTSKCIGSVIWIRGIYCEGEGVLTRVLWIRGVYILRGY